MNTKWDKKVLAVFMEWDYCDPRRGISIDKEYFLPNLAGLVSSVEPFWYDAYINDIPGLQRALIEKAKAYSPDLIFFIPYTDQFSPETLDLLKRNWATMAWFGDDSWRFESYSSKLSRHFTHVCTTDIFSAEKYKKIGVTPIVTQWAAQPGPEHAATPALGPAGPDVSFVGGNNTLRSWFIRRLEKLGVTVNCFGAGWPAGKIPFDRMCELFRTSRISLNLSNSVNHDIRFVLDGPRNLATYIRSVKRAEQIKARNFEIPLAGGFQLTNYVPGLERYFDIGKELAVFTSPEECAQQIRYYLDSEAERAAIASAGQKRAAQEHTYRHRLEKILGTIWG